MGVEMFDAARRIVIASLPAGSDRIRSWGGPLAPSDFSANGAASSQPGAKSPRTTPQKHARGLKARPITRADGSGLQPSNVSVDPAPWALPKAGMALGLWPSGILVSGVARCGREPSEFPVF